MTDRSLEGTADSTRSATREDAGQGDDLGAVVLVGAGAVQVDKVHLGCGDPCGASHALDRAGQPLGGLIESGHPGPVGECASGDELRQRHGATLFRMCEALDHQHGGPFSDEESLALAVKRPAGRTRVAVAGHDSQTTIRGQQRWRQRGIAAPAQHHITHARADQLGGPNQADQPRRARRCGSQDRPANVELPRDGRRGGIGPDLEPGVIRQPVPGRLTDVCVEVGLLVQGHE